MQKKLLIVALLAIVVHAAPANAQGYWRGWVDLGGGGALPSGDTFRTTRQRPISGGQETAEAVYSSFAGGSFTFGGGFMFVSFLGVGANISGNFFLGDDPVLVNLTVPRGGTDQDRPFLFGYGRRELALNFPLMVVVSPNAKFVRIRLFGGPSLIRAQLETLDRIDYFLAGTSPILMIDEADLTRKSDSVVGYHLGGDFAYFMAPNFGIGAYAQFSDGIATFRDFAGETEAKLGGVQLGIAANFRF